MLKGTVEKHEKEKREREKRIHKIRSYVNTYISANPNYSNKIFDEKFVVIKDYNEDECGYEYKYDGVHIISFTRVAYHLGNYDKYTSLNIYVDGKYVYINDYLQ